jgi:transposase-like protein/IS1 family transposase
MEISLARFRNGLFCPHCRGKQVVLWGKRDGVQRYRCKACRKLFNDFTGTPVARSKYPKKWPKMARALQQSMTVRETARYLDVSVSTAFRWRHRMLTGLGDARQDVVLHGIVEMDEFTLRYSEKGSRRLNRPPRKRGTAGGVRGGRNKMQVYAVIARDRTNQTRSFVLRRMSGKVLAEQARPSIAPQSLLCTDAWQSYKTFARQIKIKHFSLSSRRGQRVIHGIYHIQSVNSYQSRLRTWLRRFNGVATKYLRNYLIWQEHLDGSRNLQYGLGEKRLFVTALSAGSSLAAA